MNNRNRKDPSDRIGTKRHYIKNPFAADSRKDISTNPVDAVEKIDRMIEEIKKGTKQ